MKKNITGPPRDFRKMANKDVQRLLGLDERTVSRLFMKIRKEYNKGLADDIWLPEFCEYKRLNIDMVCAYFGWE